MEACVRVVSFVRSGDVYVDASYGEALSFLEIEHDVKLAGLIQEVQAVLHAAEDVAAGAVGVGERGAIGIQVRLAEEVAGLELDALRELLGGEIFLAGEFHFADDVSRSFVDDEGQGGPFFLRIELDLAADAGAKKPRLR